MIYEVWISEYGDDTIKIDEYEADCFEDACMDFLEEDNYPMNKYDYYNNIYPNILFYDNESS